MAAKSDRRIVDGLARMGREDNRYDALYRRVYFLLASDDGLSQHEIAGMMMFPKQTVNSAVARLAMDGMVEFAAIAGTRKEKKVRLTAAGRDFAKRTVGHLLEAEIRATKKLGVAKMNALSDLRAEYLDLLKAEFEKDFLDSSD